MALHCCRLLWKKQQAAERFEVDPGACNKPDMDSLADLSPPSHSLCPEQEKFMTSKHWTRVGGAVACLAAIFAAAQGQASPWFEPGDTYARFKLQQAADRNQLEATVSSWPLAHSNAKLAKSENGDADLSLWNELAGPAGGNASLTLPGSSDPRFIRGFEGGVREAGEIDLTLDYVGDTFAVGFSPSYAIDPTDDERTRFDGSYLAATKYNWTAGAGLIDRWWGPGWQSSMILSSNARPVPSVWLERESTRPSENILLNWLGPWQFTTFVGRMEEERFVPNANLIGMRLNVRPLNGLEIGLSRLLQWGGEGRPSSSSSLADALLGRDNVGSEGVVEDPGNQLAGIDMRYGFTLGNSTLGLYTQLVGEDEANSMPSRRVYQFGADWTTALLNAEQQWFLEWVDTFTAGGRGSEGRPNYAYEHRFYRSGMRYLGRNLATTFDGDARATTFGLYSFSSPQIRWSAALTFAELNRDGVSRFQKGSRTDIDYAVPIGEQKVAVLDLSHTRPLPGGEGSFYLSLASDRIELADHALDAAITGLEWRIFFQ